MLNARESRQCPFAWWCPRPERHTHATMDSLQPIQAFVLVAISAIRKRADWSDSTDRSCLGWSLFGMARAAPQRVADSAQNDPEKPWEGVTQLRSRGLTPHGRRFHPGHRPPDRL